MAVELRLETFADHEGESFTASPSLGGQSLELVLDRCVVSAHARPDHPAFSLLFRADGPEHLEQQIFTLRHPALGQFELFLVPVGPQEYEAVIN